MKSKKLLSLTLSLTMALTVASPALAAEETATEETVTPYTVPADAEGSVVILHSNDVHGAVEGYAKMAALKEMYEAAGANVLVVDAGDFIQGDTAVSISQGETAVELMNMVGYSLATLGNHEFDYGYENLKALEEVAEFDILAANVLYNGEPAFGTNKTVELGGKTIGLFGLETPETASKAHPGKIQGVTFLGGQDLYDCAQEQVNELEAAGCDYIICVGHLGIDDETAATSNRSIDLLEQVTGIDVFIDGHSHSTEEEIAAKTNEERTVGDTVLTSTGTKFANIGVVTIKEDGTITTECVDTNTITVAEDDPIAARAAEIRAEIAADYGTVFAQSEVLLNGEREPGNRTEETNLGDLITDAMLWRANSLGEAVDMAITNGGGIRASIEAGDVTKQDVNTVLPFGNTLNIVEVTGAELLEVLEASTFCTPTAMGGFPQVSGIAFTVNTGIPYDQGEIYGETTYYAPASIQRVSIQTVGGEAFDPESTYTVVTNDFMATGGDTYYAFTNATVNYDLGEALDTVLMDYITEELGGVITAEQYGEPAGRITIVNRPADLDEDAWWYEAAVACLDAGTLNGTDKGFDANAEITVATVYQTLYNLEGNPAAAEGDAVVTMPEDAWYGNAMNWALNAGLFTGESFETDSVITRGDTAAILADYTEMKGTSSEGLMVGNEDGDMMEEKSLTRAEWAQILVRMETAE